MRYLGHPFYKFVCISIILFFSSISQADTNPNATIIPVANTLLEGYDLHHPEISPNDSLIAFSASEKGIWRKCTISIYEVASGKVWQVTSEDSTMVWGDVLTRWSPDMTQLAFTSDRGGESHAYVVDISSGAIKKLTKTSLSGNIWMNRVAWSPDGTKIIVSLNNGTGDNLSYIDAKTGDHTKLSDFTEKVIRDLDLSRDGKRAVYVTDTGIETFDLVEKTTRLIPSSIEDISYPTWSPDGKWIGFQKRTRSFWGTFILPAKGGTAIQVGPGDRGSQVPSWSSNSRELIYHAYDNVHFELTVKDLESSNETVLLDTIRTAIGWWWGSWSADSKKITAVDIAKDESVGQLKVIDRESAASKHIANVPLVDWIATYQIPIWLEDNSGFFSAIQKDKNAELAFISLPNYDINILTDTRKPKHSIAISPDQELVIFVSGEADNENLWIYDRIIGDSYQLTKSPGQKTLPAISPSGEKILFLKTSMGFDESELQIVNIENGEIETQIDIPDHFEYHPVWIDEDTIAFTTGLDGFNHRIWLKRSLHSDREDVIFYDTSHIAQPQLLLGKKQLLYQKRWPLGPAVIQDLRSRESTVLVEKDVYTPLLSPNGTSVAFINPKRAVKPISLWREDVGHIVSQNRMP
ncbi:MAG: hypothetical protein HOK90_28610 [Gemmatimonadetes bacterium]|jgi:Tol biopolymer transport system component|nr:hypothetical protein [Gemmatimonadota bacterium]MBT7551183.1 hypothetical protein [Gemmatimonadota bacterium]